jgi:hypothetical protein
MNAPIQLAKPQLEALAVLHRGPARRTTGKTADGYVNRQAVLALCRRGFAQSTGGGVFAITDAGRRAHELAGTAPLSGIPLQGPGRWPTRTPGTELVRIPIRLDGRPVDAAEAAITFADQPWAKQARHVGTSRGFHLFERPAEAPKR